MTKLSIPLLMVAALTVTPKVAHGLARASLTFQPDLPGNPCGSAPRQAQPVSSPPACFASATAWAPLSDSTPHSVQPKDIDIDEFERLRADTNHVVLDVRTPREYTAGHVPGSVNIDFSASDFEQRVAALDKQKPYLVMCASGIRSGRAVGRMSRMGFTRIYNFSGGWNVWKKAGKPSAR
jgi:rhodanese-related sulfurtransferase